MTVKKKTSTKNTTSTKQTPAKKKASAKAAATKRTLAKRPAARKTTSAAKKMSALDAAAKVLGETKEPMRAKELIDAMASKGYWQSPGGQTPHSTLYAAMILEERKKGKDSRFKRVGPGLFAAN